MEEHPLKTLKSMKVRHGEINACVNEFHLVKAFLPHLCY